ISLSAVKLKEKKPRTSKRQILRKSVASVLLLNMLCLSTVPAMVLAEGQQTEATTSTKPVVEQISSSIPSVESLELNVKSAILMEPVSGQILLNVNGDTPLPPASMTKMMTEYIVADLVKQGKFSWDDVVTVRENASKTIGSRIVLAQGDQHMIRELYIAMSVGSANDATVALAEHVAGSEQA